MIRCYTCRGTKKLLGLGAIYRECHDCKGTGHTKPIEPAIITKQNDTVLDEPVTITVKQRGRPKLPVNVDKMT